MTRQAYLDRLKQLARDERVASLGAVIEARLAEGDRLDPPLALDEPEAMTVLFELSDALALEGGMALATLRRAAIDQLVCGLGRTRDPAYLGALARLVGHTRVVEDEDLARSLRHSLRGYLTASLPLPFDELIALKDDDLARAALALDLMLAATPVMPDWPAHELDAVSALVDQGLRVSRAAPDAARFEALLLAYRLSIKVTPAAAGSRFADMCAVFDLRHVGMRSTRRRWAAWSRHQGMVLASRPDWKRAFEVALTMPEVGTPPHQLAVETLTRLDVTPLSNRAEYALVSDAVARAWRDITGIANVTDLVLDNSLSALGFNSLQAIALIGRLESELRIEIPPRVLVEARSGAELIAAVTDRLHASAAGPAPRSPTSPSSVTAPLTKGVGAERVRGAAWRES